MKRSQQLDAEILAGLAAPEARAKSKHKIKFGSFNDDTAEILLDGVDIGYLERVKGERFASASSRARVTYVSHYTIVLSNDVLDAQLRNNGDVDSKDDAKLEIARAIDAARG